MKLAVLLVVIGCLACSALHGRAAGCERPKELVGTDVPYSLWGVCVRFTPLQVSTELTSDALVHFPPQRGDAALTLSIDRSALSPQFVEDFFESPRKDVIDSHALGQRGVAVVLTPTRLRITIYPSVVLRLREDIAAGYKTFLREPKFKVESVKGRAFAATDALYIREVFPDLRIQHVVRFNQSSARTLPDGRTQFSGTVQEDDSLPENQPPRKLND